MNDSSMIQLQTEASKETSEFKTLTKALIRV